MTDTTIAPTKCSLETPGPMLLWNDGPEGPQTLLIDLVACITPRCPCASVALFALSSPSTPRAIARSPTRVEITFENGTTARLDLDSRMQSEPVPPTTFAPSFTAELDLDKGLEQPLDLEPDSDAPPPAWFAGRFDEALLAAMRQRLGIWQRAIVDEWDWRKRDWSDWEPEQMLHFGEVFGEPATLVESEGKAYALDQAHCVVPGCSCDEAVVEVRRIRPVEAVKDEDEPLGTLWVRSSDLDPVEVEGADAASVEELKRVWALVRADAKLTSQWAERRDRVLQVGKELVARYDAAHTPAKAARTARPNDPCPCGSGKKFKRCCGL